jgi:hypothetical protein
MKTVYIETSVISYLTARPSAGLVTAAHQQITREWWDNCRTRFESFIWNCRHIDNAETKPLIRSVCAIHGYTCPEICTPEELMGDSL